MLEAPTARWFSWIPFDDYSIGEKNTDSSSVYTEIYQVSKINFVIYVGSAQVVCPMAGLYSQN